MITPTRSLPALSLRNPDIILTGLSVSIGDALPAAVQRIVENLHPEKIILFGSYANGIPTPDSDVDLLIIMNTDAVNKERSWAVSRLLLPRTFLVDILVRTPQEIDRALSGSDFLIREI